MSKLPPISECTDEWSEEHLYGKRSKVVQLMAGSNPINYRTINNAADVENIRRIYCARDTNCLEYAVSQKWSGFSCTKCNIRETKAPEVSTAKRKHHAIIKYTGE